jgi:hypothetical protein
MRIDTSISGSSGEVLSITIGDVLSVRVAVAFSQTEVNDEHTVFGLVVPANQEVVRFDISVDHPLFMHLLYSLDLSTMELIGRLKCSLSITIWIPTIRTVFKSNWRLQAWNRSSKLYPNISMTIM